MIWKTKTHEFTATVCQRTGKPCPALARMARAMAEAMATATPAASKTFEVEGTSDLTHCTEGCTARFRAQSEQIRVYCGTSTDTPTEMLDAYGDMMFGPEFIQKSAGFLSEPPCAMLDVSTLPPRSDSIPYQVSA
ncbi:hypothetical protein [Ruegeria faecimaris]|uniref:hypothetical protein n=1 Tax=Ruegeria faecimaris TaxID=686389 RepID=UPI0023310539|nr:hypothetical protein [Ruegeria faecimaris]